MYDQPYRFSTKPFDVWTGLGYWGYRHYSPKLGRWVTRDPIGEQGGLNLLRYAANKPAIASDPRGLAATTQTEIIAAVLNGTLTPEEAAYLLHLTVAATEALVRAAAITAAIAAVTTATDAIIDQIKKSEKCCNCSKHVKGMLAAYAILATPAGHWKVLVWPDHMTAAENQKAVGNAAHLAALNAALAAIGAPPATRANHFAEAVAACKGLQKNYNRLVNCVVQPKCLKEQMIYQPAQDMVYPMIIRCRSLLRNGPPGP
jgi:RHS repeat-associated protein